MDIKKLLPPFSKYLFNLQVYKDYYTISVIFLYLNESANLKDVCGCRDLNPSYKLGKLK